MAPSDRDHDELPPDPWAEEGIDLWALEQAEDLVRRRVDPEHPAWHDLDSGLEIDDFDRPDERSGDVGRGHLGRRRVHTWIAYLGYALIALMVVAALLIAALR